MNNVILIGRLIKDVELRYTQSSNATYARFIIAVDRQMSKDKKQEAEANGQPTADFINIVVWGKQAENCQSYTAQDGTRRFVTEVWAERVQFIDWGEKKEDHTQPFGQFDELEYTETTNEDIPF